MLTLGLSFYFILGYRTEYSIVESLVVGTILSATDPVATMALIKELGISKKFSILLEGESLLNDGTSIVFYILLVSVIKGTFTGIIGGLLQFLWLTVGSSVFGLVSGLFISLLIGKIIRNDLYVTLLTIFSTYFCFMVSEKVFHFSGIINIVSLGITMKVFCYSQINKKTQLYLHSVWSFLTFVIETVVFILIGNILSNIIF